MPDGGVNTSLEEPSSTVSIRRPRMTWAIVRYVDGHRQSRLDELVPWNYARSSPYRRDACKALYDHIGIHRKGRESFAIRFYSHRIPR